MSRITRFITTPIIFLILIANSINCQAEESFFANVFDPDQKTVCLYMADWCPHCKRAKDYLDKLGIDYTLYDIETAKGQEKFQALEMAQGIPIITVGSKRMDGFNEPELDIWLCDYGLVEDCNQYS